MTIDIKHTGKDKQVLIVSGNEYILGWEGDMTYLDTKIASVDVVSEKKILGCGGVATNFEQFH